MYYVHTLSWTVLKINAVTAFLKETSAYHGSTNIWKMNCCSIFFVFYGYGHRFISGFIYIHGYCRIVHMVCPLKQIQFAKKEKFSYFRKLQFPVCRRYFSIMYLDLHNMNLSWNQKSCCSKDLLCCIQQSRNWYQFSMRLYGSNHLLLLFDILSCQAQ